MTLASRTRTEVKKQPATPIKGLRWWIGLLLFASTVINFLNRQSLSALAPVLQAEHHWTNTDFAVILIGFRIAYTAMQGVGGRFIDWLGTRRGLALVVGFYSAVSILTATANSLVSFTAFRFLLGAGEGPNWPAATKAVAEWFPPRERAWGVALFDSGSSIGGALAPIVVLLIYRNFHTWRPAFVVAGALGLLWVAAWRSLYHRPEEHPRISPRELAHIREDGAVTTTGCALGSISWIKLLAYRQTWGIVLGRFLLDPYWFLMSEWFAIYLMSKGFKLEQSIIGFWAPFLAADLGNFSGAGLSSWWISKGWTVGQSRRTVLLIFGPSMLILVLAAFTSNYAALILLFAYASFAYGACSTMFLSLPADAFNTRVVASIGGLGGVGAGVGTLISTYFIGRISDRFSFQPIVIAASVIPGVAVAIFLYLVRAPRKEDPTGLLLQF
jgi:ACS family hexuronate transporter-like MFS transporter